VSKTHGAVNLVAGLALLAGFSPVAAQMQFVEAGAARGIQPYVMDLGPSGGAAAADFDDDGDIDFFVPNSGWIPDQLYRNLGDGRFEEIGAQAGVASIDRNRVALWFDFDGDRLLDLFVSGDDWADLSRLPPGYDPGPLYESETKLKLYRQVADGVFEDVASEAGFTDDPTVSNSQHRGGVAAGDIDNDGDLDLFITQWISPPPVNPNPPINGVRLFVNDGDGTFTDETSESGMNLVKAHHQPMMHDFDSDGFLDIYVAVDFRPNLFWINQGDRTFVDEAPAAGADNAWNDMGLTLGDMDADGDLDIYLTNIDQGTGASHRHNLLLRNDSVGAAFDFARLTDAGVEAGGWGWGATFMDADRDGDVDLAATNGWYVQFTPKYALDEMRFFLNQGGSPVVWEEVGEEVGFLGDTLWGSALLAVDYDRDGDLDLAQTCNGHGMAAVHQFRLFDNQPEAETAGNHYLVVRPRMEGANHRAIGAVVRLEAGPLSLMRLISAGTSYFGQEPAEAFFGVGSQTVIDRVTVEWPDGTVESHTQIGKSPIAVDQHLSIVPGQEPCVFWRELAPEVLDSTRVIESCSTIVAGAGVEVADLGELTLRAGRQVILKDGFKVESGGSLAVEIVPDMEMPAGS